MVEVLVVYELWSVEGLVEEEVEEEVEVEVVLGR